MVFIFIVFIVFNEYPYIFKGNKSVGLYGSRPKIVFIPRIL